MGGEEGEFAGGKVGGDGGREEGLQGLGGLELMGRLVEARDEQVWGETWKGRMSAGLRRERMS